MHAVPPTIRVWAQVVLGLAALLAGGPVAAQASPSDLALTATLEPPAPWVRNQRVTLTATARNLRATPAAALFYVFQPQRPDFGVGGQVLGPLPTSTCLPSPLCDNFGGDCWVVGTLQGFESRTCRVDYQVAPDAPAIRGVMRLQLVADPRDEETADNEVSFPSQTLDVFPVPALSPTSIAVLALVVLLMALRRLA